MRSKARCGLFSKVARVTVFVEPLREGPSFAGAGAGARECEAHIEESLQSVARSTHALFINIRLIQNPGRVCSKPNSRAGLLRIRSRLPGTLLVAGLLALRDDSASLPIFVLSDRCCIASEICLA